MTPLEIEILLHYHGKAGDFRGGDFSAPAVRGAIDAFKGDLELLKEDTRFADRTYQLTDKGQAYVDALQAMPLPVIRWEIPQEN